MENFNLLLLHTTVWRRGLRRKRRNRLVHPKKTNKLEFGIFSSSPTQFLTNAGYLVSVYVFTTAGIVDCLVTLKQRKQTFLHSFPNGKYQPSRLITGVRLTKKEHAVSGLLTRPD